MSDPLLATVCLMKKALVQDELSKKMDMEALVLLADAIKEPIEIKEALNSLLDTTKNGGEMSMNSITQLQSTVGKKIIYDEEKKIILDEYINNHYLFDEKGFYQITISLLKSIIQSTLDSFPTNNDEEDQILFEDIKAILNGILFQIISFDDAIRINTNNLFNACSDISSLKKSRKVKNHGFLQKHNGTELIVNDGFVPYPLQENICKILFSFGSITRLTIPCLLLGQLINEYVHGTNSNKDELLECILDIKNLFFAMSSQMKGMNTKIDSMNDNISSNLKTVDEKIDQISKTGEHIKVHQNALDDKIERRNRKEETKPFKLTTCFKWIEDVYNDQKYNYKDQFVLHTFAIKNKLSAWNQYLNTDGKKGEPPLPGFDFYRRTDKEMFKKWVRDVFFVHYREDSHKDAHKRAFHPKNIDDLNVPSQQDFYADVEEALENSNDANGKNNNSLPHGDK